MAALAGSLEDVGATLESRARDSPDLASLGSFAQYLADTGETERALETFERALRCCCSLGDPVEVANAVPFASRGSFSYYCSGYADALEGAGKPGEADAMYRTALAVKPDCPLSLGNYALFLQNARKDTDGAERFYQQAVAAHPAHASILTKYANFLKSVRGDHEQAERLFLRAIEASPENADSLGSYAVFVHSIQHDEQKAQAFYERAVQADPAHVNNLSNFGLFLSETKKDYVRAEALYKQCIELDPTHANSAYNYAVMLDSGLRDPPRAEAMYRCAIRANPRHACVRARARARSRPTHSLPPIVSPLRARPVVVNARSRGRLTGTRCTTAPCSSRKAMRTPPRRAASSRLP